MDLQPIHMTLQDKNGEHPIELRLKATVIEHQLSKEAKEVKAKFEEYEAVIQQLRDVK